MREESIRLLRQVIEDWKRRKVYTYQSKDITHGKSPVTAGEVIMRFHIQLQGFYCQGKEIPIALSSQIFHTTTLSDSPLSENVSSDQWRLEKFLKDLDEQFDALVSQKFTECPEVVFTSDPLFF